MSDRDTTIRIRGVNQASQAFQQVSRDADAMGRSVEQSGQKAARSMEDVQKQAKAIGAAWGTAIAGASLLGQMYVSQERQIRGLNAAYGEASGELQAFARHMQDVTVYSDDAARSALLTASTLQRQYGLTTEQVEQLVARSADLATVYGVDLADAVQRTSAALRGEGESAELLGLTLSDSAVAAAAAAAGLSGWNTTMTEAEKAAFRFNLLMEQSAYVQGEAAAATDTNAGKARQLVNELQDLGQSFGDALGPASEYLSVMGNLALALPLVGAGLGKVVSGLGAMGGIGVLGPLALAAGGASLAYGYSQDTIGSTSTNTFWNEFFAAGSKAMNAVLPGNPYDTTRYQTNMDRNELGDLVLGMFQLPGEGENMAIERLNALLGHPAYAAGEPFDYNWDDLYDYIEQQAKAQGMTSAQLVTARATAAVANSELMIDPVTGVYVTRAEYQRYAAQRAYAGGAPQPGLSAPYMGGTLPPATGSPFGAHEPYLPGLNRPPESGAVTAYRAGGGGAVANDLYLTGTQPIVLSEDMQAAKAATELAQYRAELEATYGAYAGLVEGINSAHDAQAAFKAAQDGLIADQQVYGGQISEYTAQQNALTGAYEILQERQAAGQKLTKEEQDLLNNYPELYGRITGGVEDATVAQGLLAAAYIENMEKGDQLNQTLADGAGATADLNRTIQDLILSMDGVPEEVRTQILLDRADESIADLINYLSYLRSIPGYVQTVIETTYVSGAGGTAGHERGALHGGVVGYADGGVVARMAEAGPELLRFANGGTGWAMTDGLYAVPRGTYVTPAPASRGQGRAAAGIVINGPITIVANDPRGFADALYEYARGASR